MDPTPPPRLSRLSKFGREWGRVTDTNDNPIAGALVYITGSDLMDSTPLLLMRTGPDGRFEFVNAYTDPAIRARRSPGSRSFQGRLVAEAAGHARVTGAITIRDSLTGDNLESVELRSSDTRLDVTLFLPEPVRIAGRVINNVTEEPIPNITLELSPPDPWLNVTATSDADGRIDFGETGVDVQMSGVREEPVCTLNLRAAGSDWLFPPNPRIQNGEYGAYSIGFDCDLEELDDVEIRLEPCDTIEVLALDPDGNPIAGADLRMACDSIDRHVYFADTDAQGRATVQVPATPTRFQMFPMATGALCCAGMGIAPRFASSTCSGTWSTLSHSPTTPRWSLSCA